MPFLIAIPSAEIQRHIGRKIVDKVGKQRACFRSRCTTKLKTQVLHRRADDLIRNIVIETAAGQPWHGVGDSLWDQGQVQAIVG